MKIFSSKHRLNLSNAQKGNRNGVKHGEYKTRLYRIWFHMKERCLNPNIKNPPYKDYGGRGITICNEWLEFIPFRDWSLNNGYQKGLEIDRRDNDGNYTPENCRFTTHKENNRNRRSTKLSIEIVNEIRALYNTKKYTQKELAIKYNTIQQNISLIINNERWA